VVALQESATPGVVVDDVDVAPRPPLLLPPAPPELFQHLDGSGDRRRADRQCLAELGRGHSAVVVDEQRGEHTGRQPGQTRRRERGTDPLDGVVMSIHARSLQGSELREDTVEWPPWLTRRSSTSAGW
jgi:hypothetical protein